MFIGETNMKKNWSKRKKRSRPTWRNVLPFTKSWKRGAWLTGKACPPGKQEHLSV